MFFLLNSAASYTQKNVTRQFPQRKKKLSPYFLHSSVVYNYNVELFFSLGVDKLFL